MCRWVSSVLALGSIHITVITKPVGELSQLITLLTTLAAIQHTNVVSMKIGKYEDFLIFPNVKHN